MQLFTVSYPRLDAQDNEFIRHYRREHDIPYRDVVDHHFTLVFRIDDIEVDAYTAHVHAVAARQRPIEFVCRYAMLVNDHDNDDYYAFLVPNQGYSEISLLHDRLYSGEFAPHRRLDIPYIPHIGIATLPDARQIKTLCDELNARGLCIQGTLDSLTICEYDGRRINDLETVGFGD